MPKWYSQKEQYYLSLAVINRVILSRLSVFDFGTIVADILLQFNENPDDWVLVNKILPHADSSVQREPRCLDICGQDTAASRFPSLKRTQTLGYCWTRYCSKQISQFKDNPDAWVLVDKVLQHADSSVQREPRCLGIGEQDTAAGRALSNEESFAMKRALLLSMTSFPSSKRTQMPGCWWTRYCSRQSFKQRRELHDRH